MVEQNKYWYYRKIYAEVCDLIEKENPNIKIDKTKNAEIFIQNHLDDYESQQSEKITNI